VVIDIRSLHQGRKSIGLYRSKHWCPSFPQLELDAHPKKKILAQKCVAFSENRVPLKIHWFIIFPVQNCHLSAEKKNIFRRATKQPEFPDVVGQYPEDGRGAFDEIHLSWWATLAVAKSPECIRMRVFDPRWFYCETLQFGGLLDLGEPNGDPKWLNAGTYESWQLMETTRHTDTKSYIMSSYQPVLISRRCKTP